MSDLSNLGINPPQGGGMGAPPTGTPPTGAPPTRGAGGMNPGGIEAIRANIRQLKAMGLSDEEILEMVLSMIEQMGGTANEEQIMQMITGVGPGGETGAPPTGAPPAMGGGAPPTATPPMR